MNGKADPAGRYRYFRIGKHLACLDQSIIDVVKFVGLGYGRNKLSSIGVSRRIGRAVIKAVIRDRLRLLDSRNIVSIPAFGHVGMQVHRGCKLFDFDRQEVTKVFGPDSDSRNALAEIAASKQASAIAAAPGFVAEDPDIAWYREEYICGIHATDAEFRAGIDIPELYPAVEKCLLDLVACEPPVRTDAGTHIDRLADSSFRNRWLDAGQDAGKVDEISGFVEELREWLGTRIKHDQLDLVLTHGDFSLVNAISTNAGLRFIDWEGIAPGGIFSDIFNFLFVERYYGRASANFLEDMFKFVETYRETIRARYPELREAAEFDLTVARRQYYLERISLLLDREISSNLCNVVCKSIAMFREFDLEAGDVAAQVNGHAVT